VIEREDIDIISIEEIWRQFASITRAEESTLLAGDSVDHSTGEVK